MRRARRLLPALLVTIAVTCALAFFIRGDVLVGIGRQIMGVLTFSNNWVEVAAGANYFDANNTHLFTNFWSLAVEEQFYLVWPLMIVTMVGVNWFAERSKIAILLCSVLAVSSSIAMMLMFQDSNTTRVYYGTDTHVFGLMIGAALAFWSRSKTAAYALRRLSQPFWWLANSTKASLLGGTALIGLIVMMFTMSDSARFTYYGGLVLASLLAALVIIATVSKRGPLQRLFSVYPLRWIGARSYGIYLWHWPLLVLASHTLSARTPGWVAPTSTLLLTFLCAALSYRFIEMPMRRHGFRAILGRSIKRRTAAMPRWKLQPHPLFIGSLVIIPLAAGAVITAPSKTQAQLRIEAGQQAIKHAQATRSKPQPLSEPLAQSVAGAQTSPSPIPAAAITGNDITVIGDSVTLASAATLQERFPGILIDAEISRSMRRGGLETIENLDAAGSLRKVVVIALATNGYFGSGNLDRVIAELGDRKIVFITAHADREWTVPNNDDLHKLAQRYKNVAIAEWDAAIGEHPEDLSEDGIHPNAQGATIYVDVLTHAL